MSILIIPLFTGPSAASDPSSPRISGAGPVPTLFRWGNRKLQDFEEGEAGFDISSARAQSPWSFLATVCLSGIKERREVVRRKRKGRSGAGWKRGERREQPSGQQTELSGGRKKRTYPCLHVFLGRVWRKRV